MRDQLKEEKGYCKVGSCNGGRRIKCSDCSEWVDMTDFDLEDYITVINISGKDIFGKLEKIEKHLFDKPGESLKELKERVENK